MDSNGGGISGSRFSHLIDVDTGDEMDVEDLHVDDNNEGKEETVIIAPSGRDTSAAKTTGKTQADEDVVVACSHAGLVEGVKMTNSTGLGAGQGLPTASQRMSKERALKDVTNKLEPKLVKLKPV